MAITTAMAPATGTDAALLHLLWLASPALPVGGFSYSEGLEAAIDAGLVQDEADATAWLVDHLHLVLSRADLAVVAQAVTAWRDNAEAAIDTLDAWMRRTRESAELRLQTEQMGRSLCVLTQTGRDDLCFPVAFALAASQSPAAPRDVALAYAFSWAENMMQAAIKSVPLGQTAGQRILARLVHEIPAAVDHALSLGTGDRQSFAPMLAILSSRHETQYSRLFRS